VPPTDGPKQITVVDVDQHDRGKDVATVYKKQEEKQLSGRVNKDVGEDANDTGVHSGKW
jgi:hypothetical protein